MHKSYLDSHKRKTRKEYEKEGWTFYDWGHLWSAEFTFPCKGKEKVSCVNVTEVSLDRLLTKLRFLAVHVKGNRVTKWESLKSQNKKQKVKT